MLFSFLFHLHLDKSKSWKENYSREYLDAMSESNFKKFVDSHRNLSEIGYIEAKGKNENIPDKQSG